MQGCNIPDIDVVVQWRLPMSISSFVQRAGRAARAEGRSGFAVLIAESSAYEKDLLVTATNVGKKGSNAKRTRQMVKSRTKADRTVAERKAYAVLRGVQRGSRGRDNDKAPLNEEPPLDPTAEDEGLHVLVQTGMCRRRVLATVFGIKYNSKFMCSRRYHVYSQRPTRAGDLL